MIPDEDTVTVLLTNLQKATPLRIRIPEWASAATATLNGVAVPSASIQNGTMLRVDCPASSTTGPVGSAGSTACNLTLELNPALRLEETYSSAVSVLRGPLLLSADIGGVFHKYNSAEQPCAPTGSGRGCGNAPFQPSSSIALSNYTASINAQQGWYCNMQNNRRSTFEFSI